MGVGLCLAILLSLGASPHMDARASFGAASSTGLIVPLYAYPGSTWQSLVQIKEQYPSVPIIAIINPASGPGSYQDPNFVSGIQQLQSVGITVIGYVPTDYGGVPVSQAEQEISTYSQFYSLSGVFFDQMSNVEGYESYYSTLTSYASSLGMWITVGNPGAAVPSDYMGTVSIIVAYESAGLPDPGFLSTLAYDSSSFAFISYGDYGFDQSFIQQVASDVGYLYVTDGSTPNPYAGVASYLSSEAATLAGIAPSSSSSSSPASSGSSSSTSTVPITVEAVDSSGNPIQGMWTVFQDGYGNVLGTGFTPDTFYANAGEQYQVSAANYGQYVFSHWGDGTTSNTDSVTANGPTTLVAYYETVGSSSDPVVTVNSFDLNGNQISGLWTVVQDSYGNVVASGYTPFSFSATPGATYTVSVANYANYNFDYWASGSSSPSMSITPTSNAELTAYYWT